jgi:hypothetical protein
MGSKALLLTEHSFPRMVGGLGLAFDSFSIVHVLSHVSSTPDVLDTHAFRQTFPVIPLGQEHRRRSVSWGVRRLIFRSSSRNPRGMPMGSATVWAVRPHRRAPGGMPDLGCQQVTSGHSSTVRSIGRDLKP